MTDQSILSKFLNNAWKPEYAKSDVAEYHGLYIRDLNLILVFYEGQIPSLHTQIILKVKECSISDFLFSYRNDEHFWVYMNTEDIPITDQRVAIIFALAKEINHLQISNGPPKFYT